MTRKFVYTDEEDKSYGLTGMALSLVVWDNYPMLRHISLDDAEGESIAFSPDFFFCSNPRFSAKIAWSELVKQYQTLTSLVMGNIMCRQIVHRRQALTPEDLADIYALIEEEGREDCQLEKDEIDEIFNKTLANLQRIYTNRQVEVIASQFADILRHRRTMSGHEVAEQIEILQR